MVGAYVAATIVTLIQYLRLRDRRLLPLAALFACQAQALGREWFDVWKDMYQNAACLAGLVMVVMLTLRPATAPPKPTPDRSVQPEQPASAAESREDAPAQSEN